MSSAPNPTPPIGGEQPCEIIIRQEAGCAPVEYHLVRPLGDGSFGVVWQARKDDAVVALKILKGTANSEETEREKKALLALEGLQHAYLLETYGYWIDGDRLIIEMELADGGSLKDRLKRFKAAGFTGIPVSELLKYFGEAAEALDYLHACKSFHRDIKPGNILLVDGCAKLADFGLLRQVAGDKSHTHTTGGTHAYMSPESILNNVASRRADLFSLAVSYAQLRQGALPFTGTMAYEIMTKIVNQPPELSDEIFDLAEKAVLERAMDKDPTRRHPSCGEFVAALADAVPFEEVAASAMTANLVPLTPGVTELDNTDMGATTKPGSGRRKSGPPARVAGKGSATQAIPSAPTITSGTAPTRRRKRRRLLRGMMVATFLLALCAGGWFLVHTKTKDDIRQLVKKKEFPEAMQSIQDTPPWLLPFPDVLEAEVEKAWWRALDPDRVHDPERLKQLPDELKKFREHFAHHPDLPKREEQIRIALNKAQPGVASPPAAPPIDPGQNRPASVSEVRLLIGQNKLDEAGKWIASLPPADQALVRADLKEKQDARKLLTKVQKSITANEFPSALMALKAAEDAGEPRFEFSADRLERDKLLNAAKSGERGRLVAAADDALKAKNKTLLASAVENVTAFRDRYPSDRWMPDLGKYRIAAVDVKSVIDRAWKAYLDDRIADCRKEIANPESDVLADPDAMGNLLVLRALVDASGGPKRHESASRLVAAIRAEKRLANSLAPRLWRALTNLTKLEKKEDKDRLFQFQHAIDLVESVPAQSSEVELRSKFIAHLLDSLVNAKECWHPDGKQWDQCRQLCELMNPQDKTPFVVALQVECSLESQTEMIDFKTALKVLDAANASWYPAYAAALLRKETDAKTANLLAKELGRDLIEPKPRIAKAVAMLRGAVRALPRIDKGSKEFKGGSEATKAQIWLEPVVAAETNKHLLLADLIELGLAAGKLEESDTLKNAAERATVLLMDRDIGVADKESAFYWLARSYRACGTSGEHTKSVFQFCDESLKVDKSSKSEWRRRAAREGAAYALELGNAERQNFDSAIAMSHKARQYAASLKDVDFGEAADQNGAAFVLLLKGTKAKSGGKLQEVINLYMAKWPDELEAFHAPVVTQKLKYLREAGFFVENSYEKILMHNPYFEKTMDEARLVLEITQSDGGWWKRTRALAPADVAWLKRTRAELLRARFSGQFEYAEKAFNSLLYNDKGDFEDKHLPYLKETLKLYLNARQAASEAELDKEQAYPERLSYKIGYSHAFIGGVLKTNGMDKEAIQCAKDAVREFRQVSDSYRQTLKDDQRNRLRVEQALLESVIDKAKK